MPNCQFCNYSSKRRYNVERHTEMKHPAKGRPNLPIMNPQAETPPIVVQPPASPEEEVEPEPEPMDEQSMMNNSDSSGSEVDFHSLSEKKKSHILRDNGLLWKSEEVCKRAFFSRLGPITDPEGLLETFPICLYTMFQSVEKQGGFVLATCWELIGKVAKVPYSEDTLKEIYITFLLGFEKKEEKRIMDLEALGCPLWWDYGEFISHKNFKIGKRAINSNDIRKCDLDKIYLEYYKHKLDPERSFQVKDSWVAASRMTPQDIYEYMKIEHKQCQLTEQSARTQRNIHRTDIEKRECNLYI